MSLAGRAERKLGRTDLIESLAQLSTSDWTSIQMATAERRAARRTPSVVLAAWMKDPYVLPVAADARTLRRLELAMLEEALSFEAIELSPLAPLGACSTFSIGGQNRVLAAARDLEVLADPTNALALECAARRRSDSRAVRLCACTRVVRAQPLVDPTHTRHFSLLSAVTAERHRDSRAFAEVHLEEHIRLHARLHSLAVDEGTGRPATALRLLAADEMSETAERLAARLQDVAPRVDVDRLESPYYAGLRFQLSSRIGDVELPLSDGGVFDWMRTLCSDRKEQLCASAIGVELAVRIQRRDDPVPR